MGWKRLLAVGSLLAVTGAIVFGRFLFGQQLLLYKDIGSDSIHIDLSLFTQFSDYLRHVGLPTWSFQFGLGQSLYPYIGALLLNPVVWLAKDMIPEALAWQHLAKIVCVGLLFFRFLELRGLNFASATGGAFFLSFSSYMTLGSCYSIVANEILVLTFLLFAVEQIFSRRRWIYLAGAVALLGCVTVFHFYLGAILLSAYFTFRTIEIHGWRLRPFLSLAPAIAAIVFLGVMLSAVVALDGADAILHSPRGSGMKSYTGALSSSPVFGFNSSLHYVTAIGRAFAPDLLGRGSEFRGWKNYFEAPPLYCGLLCLVLLPQVFVGASARQRWLTGIVLTLVVLPIVFPWFRFLFWAFQGDYYRALSLFTVFAVITLAATAHWNYSTRQALNLWLLGATLLVLLGFLWAPVADLPALVSPGMRKAVSVFLVIYAVFLALGHYLRRWALFGWLVLGISVVELGVFTRLSVSDRPVVTKAELKERVGYNDYTVDAMRELKKMDDGFFRVRKLFSSGPSIHTSLNDALMFGYFGTSVYSSFNHVNYVRFLMALEVLPPNPTEHETRWLDGLTGRSILSTFTGEKYLLTKELIPVVPGGAYELLGSYGPIHLYRNNLWAPFGLTFHRYIPEAEFRKLPREIKELALLQSVVLFPPEAQNASGLALTNAEELEALTMKVPIADAFLRLRDEAFRLQSFQQNQFHGTIASSDPAIVVFQMPRDPGWRAFLDGRRVPTLDVDAGLLGVAVPAGKHSLELRYAPRFLLLGAIISGLAALILLIAWWRWPKLTAVSS